MHLLGRSLWSLFSLAALGSAASNVVEMDVVFPRNATYRPSEKFPVILAFRNGALAKNLDITMVALVWKREGTDLVDRTTFLPSFNLDNVWTKARATGNRPYIVRAYLNLTTEGQHGLDFSLSWRACNELLEPSPGPEGPGQPPPILRHTTVTSDSMVFNIAKDAPELDLVAATSDEKTCLAQSQPQPGVAITLTGERRDYPAFKGTQAFENPGGTCELLPEVSKKNGTEAVRHDNITYTTDGTSTSTPNDPCRVNLGPSEATSIVPAAPTGKENGAVQLRAVATVASLTVAVTAMGFLLL